MRKLRLLAFLFALVLFVSLPLTSCDFFPSLVKDDETTGATPTEKEESAIKTITFVSINDLHGYIEQDSGRGGLSNTAYAIDRLSHYYGDYDPRTTTRDDIVLFANGDMFQGTAISNMSRGEAVLVAMNEMGFDAMGIGNHEFDWGIDEVLRFFDGDPANGEANFPLVNSNITKVSEGALLADVRDDDNIVSTATVVKEGVKIGLIGAIGPCRNSILQTNVADYDFEDVAVSVRDSALALKADGCDLISVNIHYGNASDVLNYQANKEIANLKDANGNYLVDLIFNGHTHTEQKGVVRRNDGSSVPIVQAAGSNGSYAAVTVLYDTDNHVARIRDYDYYGVSLAGQNYDAKVEAVIDDYSERLLSGLPTLAVSAVTVRSKSTLYDYMADVMLKATGAEFAVSNHGGLRGTGDIKASKPITEANLYEIIPFDNEIYFVTIRGDALYDYYDEEADYNYFGSADGAPTFDELKGDDTYYTLAIIDYLYTGAYFTGPYKDYSPFIREAENTHLMLRELFIEDVSLAGETGQWNPASGARIEQKDF